MEINFKEVEVTAKDPYKWIMTKIGNDLKFAKNVGTKKTPVRFTYFFLKRTSGSSKAPVYVMTFPEMNYVSRTAFFTARNENEIHLKRAKTLISSMFTMLKRTGLAPLIENFDKVVRINTNNAKTDKALVLQELQKMTSIKE